MSRSANAASERNNRPGLFATRKTIDVFRWPWCEIVSIESTVRRRGVARALVDAVIEVARGEGAHELWLVTTNDNVGAIACYERLGFTCTGVDAGAVDRARRELKPSVPAVGEGGVPIRDELEFHRPL